MKKKLLIILVFFGLVTGLQSTTVKIRPQDDVHVRLNDGSNFEGAFSLKVGVLSPTEKYLIFIRFNLNQIPQGANITQAKLKMVVDSNMSWGETVVLKRVDQLWNPTTIHGNNCPQPQDTYAATIPTPGQPAIWDVTQLVEDWLSGTPNYGLVLVPIANPAQPSWWYTFYSTEMTIGTHVKPQLIVEY